MGWNGSGGYVRQENFSADSSAGIKILATRMDTELDDVGSAITVAFARNGQNSPTANLPMAGYRLTNVGAAASVEDYLRVKEFIRDVPIFAKDVGQLATAVRVSVAYYASVSAGQSPPDGARMKVLIGPNGSKGSTTCSFYLFTPLNTSAGAQPHVAPVWTRGRKFDPNAIRADHVYEFVYEASASGWRCLNPSRSYYTVESRAKVKDATGTLAGQDGTSVVVAYSRTASQLAFSILTTVSVSCSISGKYLYLSANGVTSQTSGAITSHTIPITVKDVMSHTWTAQVQVGQVVANAAFDTAGTTVSAACTIRAAPFTAVFIATP